MSGSGSIEAACTDGFMRALRAGLTFRPETAGDLPFLEALYASTRAEELAQVPDWSEAQKAGFLAMQFRAQHGHYRAHYPDALWLVVEAGDERVGRLYLERWTREWRIIDIALMPGSRGRGFGSAILADIMEMAGGEGRSVSIHVEKTNPAMTLYRRLGFTRIEDKGVYDLLEWSRGGAAAGAAVS